VVQSRTPRSHEEHLEGANRLDTALNWRGSADPGQALAVMQVSGGSQSFNAVNQMRVLGRWMRMITVPNQSSVAKAYQLFDDKGRMKPSSCYDRFVDVVEARRFCPPYKSIQ
jgi:NAD(P)H-dependent FMN reductase